jgi:hypothetical protein
MFCNEHRTVTILTAAILADIVLFCIPYHYNAILIVQKNHTDLCWFFTVNWSIPDDG